MRLRQRISKVLLYRLLGWSLVGELPRDRQQLILVFLPHTSNWDFVYGMLFIWAENLEITLFGKDAFYFFPFRALHHLLRVVPIRRNKSDNFVQQTAPLFQHKQHLWVAIAPEGTRSKTTALRSGYYYLARQAEVPISEVGADFKARTFNICPARMVAASFEEDQQKLLQFAARMQAKNPSLSI